MVRITINRSGHGKGYLYGMIKLKMLLKIMQIFTTRVSWTFSQCSNRRHRTVNIRLRQQQWVIYNAPCLDVVLMLKQITGVLGFHKLIYLNNSEFPISLKINTIVIYTNRCYLVTNYNSRYILLCTISRYYFIIPQISIYHTQL